MKNYITNQLPRGIFMFLSLGASWASGLYLGILSVKGASLLYLIKIIAFGILALFMAWGALSKNQKDSKQSGSINQIKGGKE